MNTASTFHCLPNEAENENGSLDPFSSHLLPHHTSPMGTIFLGSQSGTHLVIFVDLTFLLYFKWLSPPTVDTLLPILIPPSLGAQRVLVFLVVRHLMT